MTSANSNRNPQIQIQAWSCLTLYKSICRENTERPRNPREFGTCRDSRDLKD